MPKKTVVALIKTVLPLLLGVYLFWYFFSSMSEESIETFYRAMNNADYLWILLSLLLGFIALVSRAIRWKYVLEPIGHETKFWHRYHAILIGYLINYTIPRAGEASRSAMLYRSDGVPFMKSFGTIITERAVDLVMLGSIAVITIFIGYNDFVEIKQQMSVAFNGETTSSGGFQWKYVIIGFFGLGLILALVVFMKNKNLRMKFIGFIKDVFAGVFSIFKANQPLGYIFHTIVIWVCYIGMFALPFHALNQTADVPMAGIFMGFIAGSLGIVFTNGGIGAYPLLVGLVVGFYLKDAYPLKEAQGIGNALGLLIWISQTVMMITLGLISLVLLPKNYSKEHDQARIPSTQNS